MPRVSVVVATYRRDQELRRALDSLKAQQFKDFETIIVDDNADQDFNIKVSAVVDAFKRENPQMAVTLITNPRNMGSAETRNIGINASKGEYITFLDDDDVYLPAKIKNHLEFMEKGDYDYSVTDLDLYNESDKLIRRRARGYVKETSYEALLKYHLMYHITGTDSMMFKKDYLLKIKGFAPINVGDEFYLMLRAINEKGKFGYLPGCDIKAYIHTGECGLSSGEGKVLGENNLYEYKKSLFDKLDKKTIRYINMRHFAVLAFAQVRRKKYGQFITNSVRSFMCSPKGFMQMLTLEK
ncbi:MAG: glycosyltransferase family 2 protein [Clostridia bacterium]|nr:glycosyltransferase family 2 protein [Clostridia bacterium]